MNFKKKLSLLILVIIHTNLIAGMEKENVEVLQAINIGQVEKLKSLNFNAEGEDYHGKLLIFCAVASGKKEIVEIFVMKHVNLMRKYLDSNILHYAASNGYFVLIKYLLHLHGTKKLIDERDSAGDTPLSIAIKNGFEKVVELLIDHKASTDLQDHEGNDAAASAFKSKRLKIIDLVMSAQSDEPWDWIIGNHLTCDLILDKKRIDYKALLFIAAHQGCEGLVTYLLKSKGFDVNSKDESDANHALLQIAAREGFLKLAAVLLDLGADMYIKSNDANWTPFQYAAKNNPRKVAKLFIKRGVEIDASYAWSGYHLTALMLAVQRGFLKMVNLLIENGADVNFKADRDTALHLAAARGNVLMVKRLIEARANTNIRSAWYGGNLPRTPLHLAAMNGHGPVIELLIAHGADASLTNTYHSTALDLAIAHGHGKAIEKCFTKK